MQEFGNLGSTSIKPAIFASPLHTAFCGCVFGREHLPKAQPAVHKRAEPPGGVQSSLALLFPPWELMAIENHREIHAGNELPPHLFLGKPIYPAVTSPWDVLGRVAGAEPDPVMHSLLPAVAWDVHPIWETQGLVEPRAAAQA